MIQGLLRKIGFDISSSQYQPEVELTPFTPDLWKLEQYFFQNVFIYNELMKGCSRFSEVMDGNAVKLSVAVTKEDNYVMWMKDLGYLSQAFVLPIGPEHKMGMGSTLGIPGKIMGHLYSMRPSQIKRLDDEMQNGIMFKRKRIKIEIPFRYKQGRTTGELQSVVIPAWSYIGNIPYWLEQMDPLNKRCRPVTKYFPRTQIGSYYYYAEKYEKQKR